MSAEVPASIHPAEPPRFRSEESLVDHVVKHVVAPKNRDDWQGLLNELTIERARREYEAGRIDSATDELAQEYQAMAGAELLESCALETTHEHFRGSWPHAEGGNQRAGEDFTLVGWSPDERVLWIVAAGRVRNQRPFTYQLRSMYRLGRGLSSWQREWKLLQRRQEQEERGLVPFKCPGPGEGGSHTS